MGARQRIKADRQARLKQIHKMLILGLSNPDIAERLGCNEKTVRRDMEADRERINAEGDAAVAANRTAILAELGRTYAEAVKEGEIAKASGLETWPFMNTRIRALGLMARISGAEMPARMVISGRMSVSHKLEAPVQMVSQEELRKMALVEAEIARQAPAAIGNGETHYLGNGNGNGDGDGNGQD